MKIINLNKLVLTVLIALVSVSGIKAQPAGWSGMQLFYVAEHTGSNLYNYQLKLTVNTQDIITAGMMNANGDDIRFGNNCAGTKQYNYWIESGINTASTIIWVKLDTLLASTTQSLYMYYGNPTAGAVSSIPTVFSGPNSSTDSICCGTAQAVHNCQRGFKFAPTEDLLVTNLGRYEPNGTTRYVTLFDFTSQAQLQQLQVSGAATQWSYGAIANPFWLTQSTTYVLTVFQGAADSYYSKASTQIGQQILFYDVRFINTGNQNTFPTGSNPPFNEYGFADLLYWRKNTVANPPTYTLGNPLTVTAPNTAIVCGGAAVVIGNLGQGGTYPYTYSWSPSVGLSDTTLPEPLTNAAVISTFVETVTDAAGCVATNSVTVTPYNLPIVVAHISADTVCEGGTVILTGSGAASYVWNYSAIDGTPIAPPASMKYTVTGTDANGCVNADSIDIVVNLLPTVGATTTSTTICAGDMITLNGTGAVSYAWAGGETDGVSFAPLGSTTYSVTGTDGNGCTNTANISVTVNPLPVVTGVASFPIICEGSMDTLMGQGATTYMWDNGVVDGVAFAANTGVTTYTVIGTDNNNCSNTATVTITVNTLPTVVANASDINICTGDSDTLTGSGASTYVWDNSVTDGIGFVPSATTNYTVTGTDANNCSNTSSVNITVNPLPSVTIDLSIVDTLCVNWGVMNLIGESPLGGTYSGAGVTGNTIDAGIAGVGAHYINYVYTDGNGCINSDADSIYIDLCTGINDVTDNSFSISAYPSPTPGVVHITVDRQVRIAVYNTLDQKIIDKEIPTGKNTINLNEYSKGIYTLRAVSGRKVQTIKIIKE